MAKRRNRDRTAAEETERLDNEDIEATDEDVLEDDRGSARFGGRRSAGAGGFVEQAMATGEALTVGVVTLAVNTLKAVVYGVVDVAATAIEGVQEIGARVVGAEPAGSRPLGIQQVRARTRRREANDTDRGELREVA